MAELLLEILSEEIPARMQTRAADNLKRLIINSLENDGLKFESLQTFVTPRRLTLVVNGLPVQIEAVEEDRRGPPKAAPEKAVKGFAKANNVSVFDLEIRDT
ncbi:MAG: glycine--tRNA ligase subunit beta, partial [Rhodospirillales bacterium]|nr:glycine--tRNA ligase subunit beta [Rhodospirillales bacterium]